MKAPTRTDNAVAARTSRSNRFMEFSRRGKPPNVWPHWRGASDVRNTNRTRSPRPVQADGWVVGSLATLSSALSDQINPTRQPHSQRGKQQRNIKFPFPDQHLLHRGVDASPDKIDRQPKGRRNEQHGRPESKKIKRPAIHGSHPTVRSSGPA